MVSSLDSGSSNPTLTVFALQLFDWNSFSEERRHPPNAREPDKFYAISSNSQLTAI